MSGGTGPSRPEQRFQGLGVSPGLARGRVVVIRRIEEAAPDHPIAEAQIPHEVARFEAALLLTRTQITELQVRIAGAIGAKDASIFDAHLLVVEDRTLIDEVLRALHQEKRNIEAVFQKVADRYANLLDQMDDAYLRERALDVHDVTRRVLMNLAGRKTTALADIKHPHILLAHNLTPSDTAQLNRDLVLGFATDAGSRTSHTAIMARSLNIPAIVGLHDLSSRLESNVEVLLDGYHGLLVLDPSEQTLSEYEELERRKQRIEAGLVTLRETASTTLDGHHLTLSANIELPDDIPMVKRSGAEGIGLYRTEFFFLNKEDFPDEEEQYQAYKRVASEILPHGIIIRTLDLGGDKLLEKLSLPAEMNPFLGYRAIRFCLEQEDIFKRQLRAVLRASALGNVKLMYPMISGIEEVRRANAILNRCKEELRQEGQPFNEDLDVGIMIEVPSAALCADQLAREVDFFSLGTNDLIQYSIAVDRVNERIAHLYEPTHPAIVRLMKMVVDAAHANGIWAGVCGEMASEVVLTPLLLGLGVDELSAGGALVPRVKSAVQRLEMSTCRALVENALNMETGAAILAECEKIARQYYPELLG